MLFHSPNQSVVTVSISKIIVYLGIRAGEVPSGGFFGDFEVAVFLMDGADHSMVLTSSRSPRR